MTYSPHDLAHLSLGQQTVYAEQYDPALLQGVPRALNRDQLGISQQQPFNLGADLWTAFELSWLNPKGLPQVAIADVAVDYRSRNLIESKSFKLYLNSFNQSRFASGAEVEKIITRDLAQCAGGEVKVRLNSLEFFAAQPIAVLEGECIDHQDIDIVHEGFRPDYLADCTGEKQVEEYLVSHLLKSNCLITAQPDWGSLQIHYVGKQIQREKLLRYIVSFRQHNEFHEQCIERIFCDILRFAQPEKLTVYGRYTRRGGLDINPFRSNFEQPPANLRLARQ